MKYKHSKRYHNLKSPRTIVPEIIKLLSPKSVVDIGCGTGTFLNVFKSLGVSDILGIDGAWVNKDLLYENINPEEFLEFDLEKRVNLNKKYDLVISLEVAEHLNEKSADIFVESLVNAGDLIVFSAAIPYQGGQNHINEQWSTYWEEKFLKHNYVFYDIFRPILWNNLNVWGYYKNNMFLIAPEDLELNFVKKSNIMENAVHYDMYYYKAKYVNRVIRGEFSPSIYLKWLMFSIFGFGFISRIKHLLTGNKKH